MMRDEILQYCIVPKFISSSLTFYNDLKFFIYPKYSNSHQITINKLEPWKLKY
jgi:hypothetical protein